MMITILADVVVDHPEAVKWLLGAMFALILTLVGTFWGIVSSKLSKLEAASDSLEGRVGDVEVAIGKYEEHVGAGDRGLKDLTARVEKHMGEEERVWVGISELKEQLNEIQIQSLKAHAEIVGSFSPRLATIETKVERIEKNLPNGELKEAVVLLRKLAGERS